MHKWNCTNIIKCIILGIVALANVAVSFLMFFDVSMNSKVLGGMLIANSSVFSFFRPPKKPQDLTKFLRESNSSLSCKLDQLHEFIKQIDSSKSELTATELYSNRTETPQIISQKTPRFKAKYDHALNQIEITQVDDEPNEDREPSTVAE